MLGLVRLGNIAADTDLDGAELAGTAPLGPSVAANQGLPRCCRSSLIFPVSADEISNRR